jgi:precorrin-6x reductase
VSTTYSLMEFFDQFWSLILIDASHQYAIKISSKKYVSNQHVLVHLNLEWPSLLGIQCNREFPRS